MERIHELERALSAAIEREERLKKQLELGYENFDIWYRMATEKHVIVMGETQRQQFFEILQALKEK